MTLTCTVEDRAFRRQPGDGGHLAVWVGERRNGQVTPTHVVLQETGPGALQPRGMHELVEEEHCGTEKRRQLKGGRRRSSVVPLFERGGPGGRQQAHVKATGAHFTVACLANPLQCEPPCLRTGHSG